VVLDEQRVAIVGGLRQDTIEVLDLEQGVSRQLATRLPMPLDDLRAVALTPQRVWILGGQDSRTGETTDRTWLLELGPGDRSRLVEGPPLGITEGMADAGLVRVDRWWAMVGGESQRAGRDTELDVARLLDPETRQVWSLPRTAVPHDDAATVTAGRSLIVLGGMFTAAGPLEGMTVPHASVVVERLELPASLSGGDR
jgi:hypothetical protein